MWFLGFSTISPKSLWMIGAITLAVFMTILFRRFAMYLDENKRETEAAKGNNSMRDNYNTAVQIIRKGQNSNKEQQEVMITTKITTTSSTSTTKHYGWPAGVMMIKTYGLEELKVATRDFRFRIGVGATSFVYLAELGDGRFGAVKRVMEDRGGSKKIFMDELSVLLRVSHPNLVGLMGCCMDKGEQLLLLEYVPNKSLFDRMHTQPGQSLGILTWSNRLSIALDIARALNYLHSQADPAIIHRDVKSSNILLIDNDHAKLADFGLCKLGYNNSYYQINNHHSTTPSPTTIKGSLGYVDTTYLKTGHVSPKSDVYSYGVLLLELITGLKAVQGSVSLTEWTEEFRKVDEVEIWAKMLLDPKLHGNANSEQLRVLIRVANLALLENAEARPQMSHIVDSLLTSMELEPPHQKSHSHLLLQV